MPKDTHALTIRLRTPEHEGLTQAAKDEDVSINHIIKMLIKDYLETRKKQ